MNFYDILLQMKTGKKVPYSKDYFDTLFAAKLAEMQIKTLTGTLPLTFRTSETTLRSWTIYGNNYEHTYSAEGTLPLTFTTHTAGNADEWEIEGNDNVGKNLYDYENAELTNYYIDSNGEQRTGGGSLFRTQNILVTPSENYTISWADAIQPGLTPPYIRVCFYNGQIFISRSTYSGMTATSKTVTFTTPSNCDNILLQLDDKTSAQGQYFVDVMLNAGDTSADFEPYQVGVGQRTKNLLEITATTQEINGITFMVDKTTGTITANGTAIGNVDLIFSHVNIPANIQYVMSGSIESPSSTADRIAATYIDQYANIGIDYGSGFEFSSTTGIPNAAIKIRIFSGKTVTNAVFKPMLRLANTTPDFIPYGYEIPLAINNTEQVFYIGDTPLTAGQSISKTSTGVDITAVQGANTITTDLYNKPEMSIEGVDYVGVGEPVNDSWQIPLTVKNTADLDRTNSTVGFLRDNGEIVTATDFITTDFIPVQANTHLKFTQRKTTSYDIRARLNVYNADKTLRRSYWEGRDFQADSWAFTIDITQAGYYRFCLDNSLLSSVETTTTYTIPIDAPLTEGESVTDTLTISTFEGENTLDTTMTNKPNMSITYKGG